MRSRRGSRGLECLLLARTSVAALRMSAIGGKADIIFCSANSTEQNFASV